MKFLFDGKIVDGPTGEIVKSVDGVMDTDRENIIRTLEGMGCEKLKKKRKQKDVKSWKFGMEAGDDT